MKFVKLPLKGTYMIEFESSTDERGVFFRTFCKNRFHEIGFNRDIVQINHSITKQKGTIRGMHYQLPPACETKLVRCVHGKVYDVALDIRHDSSTYMRWIGVELSDENMRMVLIPEGFAHGFQSLTDDASMIYLHSEFYNPECERGIRYDDPVSSISWPLPISVISQKDGNYPLIGSNFRGI